MTGRALRRSDGARAHPKSDSRLSVLHVVSSLQVGGMERFALRLAQRQRRAGLDARLLALRGGPLAQEAESAGVPVVVVERDRAWWRLIDVGAEVLKNRPGIVHAHNATSLRYAALISRATRAGLVVTHHGSALGAGRQAAAWEWRTVDALAGVSSAVLTELPLSDLAGRVSVVHNGISPPEASDREAARQELGLGSRLTGIIVARLDGNKGHADLLRALAILRRHHAPPLLLVAGDGRARAEIEALVVELGLGGDVRMLGVRTDVDHLLSAADFFVLPSRAEGLPLSVLEAMAHGVPPIGTRVGGIPEVITHREDGLLVPVDQPAALAGAIQELCADAALRERLGSAARATVRRRFTYECMFQRYQELYQSIPVRR